MQVTVDVELDDIIDEYNIDDILGNFSDKEIKDYLARRKVGDLDAKLTDKQIRYVFTQLCIGRCPRNMEFDKATIRSTILQLLDQVF